MAVIFPRRAQQCRCGVAAQQLGRDVGQLAQCRGQRRQVVVEDEVSQSGFQVVTSPGDRAGDMQRDLAAGLHRTATGRGRVQAAVGGRQRRRCRSTTAARPSRGRRATRRLAARRHRGGPAPARRCRPAGRGRCRAGARSTSRCRRARCRRRNRRLICAISARTAGMFAVLGSAWAEKRRDIDARQLSRGRPPRFAGCDDASVLALGSLLASPSSSRPWLVRFAPR